MYIHITTYDYIDICICTYRYMDSVVYLSGFMRGRLGHGSGWVLERPHFRGHCLRRIRVKYFGLKAEICRDEARICMVYAFRLDIRSFALLVCSLCALLFRKFLPACMHFVSVFWIVLCMVHPEGRSLFDATVAL